MCSVVARASRGSAWATAAGAADVEVNNLMARVTDTVQSRIDSIKGGAVLTDKKVTRLQGSSPICSTWTRPAVIGMIQQAGKDAASMSAMMETGWLVTNRMMQDVHALGARIMPWATSWSSAQGRGRYGAAKAGQHSGLNVRLHASPW
jgi:hypothetical protein